MAYGSDEGFAAWLAGQGLELPDGANAASLRTIGSVYVDAAYEPKLSACSRRAGGFMQDLAWPRAGLRLNGQPVPSDLIPPAWISASYRAAYLEALTPGWATGSADPNRITRREQVDTISREFFAPGDTGGGAAAPGIASDAIINGMVLPWLCSGVRTNPRFLVI
ncbi:hypothetical protein IMZ29_00795 [Achromobacter sp. GG226]|uniref:DnaT-like ssDNA-binding protein n=1 Tax=Verticiella alkaliphila TaxID=2779529 RepID=UPI001C0CE2F5|nr:DnaT-like ssDNA-binding protein [Verticiella sp. GG226]MBU4609140.1 hypothetical protein [Verticiella sp. GG226]